MSVTVKMWDKKYVLQFVKREYLTGNLAIEVVTKNKNVWKTWCFLTVNLPGFMLNENEAFLDTNNCSKEIIDWILKNHYAKIIGVKKSGFCTYPLVELSETFMEMILISEEDLVEKTKETKKWNGK